jgi:hypothetical protein
MVGFVRPHRYRGKRLVGDEDKISENEKTLILDMLRTVRIGIIVMAAVYLGLELGVAELIGLV